jgi:hypothetical protein
MNPKEADKLAEVFPPNTAQAREDRNTTIKEMIHYLIYKDKRMYAASNAMLTHLMRLADNHHMLIAGRSIVRRQVEMSWEYSVLCEIQQVEINVQRPIKLPKRAFKAHWLSESDRDALDLALNYYDVILRD